MRAPVVVEEFREVHYPASKRPSVHRPSHRWVQLLECFYATAVSASVVEVEQRNGPRFTFARQTGKCLNHMNWRISQSELFHLEKVLASMPE